MQPKEFYIPTTWRLKASVEQVYDVGGFEGLARELARRASS